MLYVQSKCFPSRQLQELLQEYPTPTLVVQDAHQLHDKPDWLIGTPSIVDIKLGLLYKGSDAICLVQKLVQQPSHEDHTVPVEPRPDTTPREALHTPTKECAMGSLFELPSEPLTPEPEKKRGLELNNFMNRRNGTGS